MGFHWISGIIGDPLYDPNRHAMKAEIEWDCNGMPHIVI